MKKIRSTPEGAAKHRDRERARYYDNPEIVKMRAAEWYKKNPERAKIRGYLAHKNRMVCPVYRVWETFRQWAWYQRNQAKGVAKTRKRQLKKVNATPSWLTAIHNAQIHEFYEISIARSVQTGIECHVDHIHSLNGENFSGLHVPWNLQVIEASMNCSKANKPPEHEREMFWEAA